MKGRIPLTALALVCALVGNAQAKEGADQYPNGADTWYSGALPPPGGYFLNYFGYYDAELKNGNGDKVEGSSARAWFDALRYLHVSEHRILGANWAWHVIVPLVHQRTDLGGGSKSVAAVGDITINPFALAWHSTNWHWVAGISFIGQPADTGAAPTTSISGSLLMISVRSLRIKAESSITNTVTFTHDNALLFKQLI